ncbi:MAG: hypothetical protein Q9196_004360 [Gyalolechia fulgens]
MPERTRHEALRQRISSGGAEQLRFWEVEASKKYDGRVVELAETVSATEYLPSEPVHYLALVHHPSESAWHSCRKHIVQILEDADVNWTSVQIQLERDSSNRARPVLLVIVEDASRQEIWREATVLLDKMLYVNDVRDLAITIRVPKGPKNVCIAIKPDDPLVTLWPQKLRMPIFDLLEQRTRWESMGVFRYGPSLSSSKPTVLITVPDLKDQDYTVLENDLNDELSRLQAPSLRVKIVQGALNGKTNDELPTGRTRLQTYTKLADMGYSIGTDDRGSGTLGGYIGIKKGEGKTRVCALTNFHVVRHVVPNWRAEFDTNGIPLFQYPRQYCKVWCPSNRDHEIELENLQASTEDEDSTLDRAKAKINAGMATEGLIAGYERRVATRDLHARRLALCQTIRPKDREFGEVIAASGYRKSDQRRLDWALISANPPRIGANTFPEPDELLQEFDLRGETKAKTINQNTDYMDGLFFKIGRSTGLTFGIYNGIQTDVKMPLPVNHQTESTRQERQKRDAGSLKYLTAKEREAKYAEPFYQYTQEHTIVSRRADEGRVFSKAGDSGSWVFDEQAMLVGMIFGDNGQGATFFTPIALILADIELMTGCTVELM